MRGQIKWGTWGKTRGENRYHINTYDVEGGKRVKIEFTHYPNGTRKRPFDHVYANHAHLFG